MSSRNLDQKQSNSSQSVIRQRTGSTQQLSEPTELNSTVKFNPNRSSVSKPHKPICLTSVLDLMDRSGKFGALASQSVRISREVTSTVG